MKIINITWKHYDKDGQTCKRCAKTGVSLQQAIKELTVELKSSGIEIKFDEVKLEESEMAESNSLTINDTPIETLIEGSTSENCCNSCSDLTGKPENCRTISVNNTVYEDLPKELLMEAIIRVKNEIVLADRKNKCCNSSCS